MKVLIGHFTAESNEHVLGLTELNDFSLKFDEELIDSMHVKEIFEKENIEIVPAIYASAVACKVISKEAFDYMSKKMIRTVREHFHELDGIFLFLHGASKVEGLEGGSGERYILKEIRKITGPYFPIAVVMDPHGNLTDEYVSMMSIGRSYRESPHTDIKETYEHVAQLFVDYLKHREYVTPIYKKLPFLLGGEKSVSTDEPMLSINKQLNDAEQDERIMSASFHIGYLRHDNYSAGTGLIVIPSKDKYKHYAEEVAEKLKKYIISKMKEFKYHGLALDVDDAIEKSIHEKLQHVVVTDSGDNATSGAEGANTELLSRYLALDNYQDKQILFAGINDSESFSYILTKKKIGETFDLSLGYDKEIKLMVTLKNIGTLQQIFGDTSNWGKTITVSVANKPIDIVLMNKSVSLAETHQFEAAKIDLSNYNIVIVKQGYVFPDLKKYANLSIMALTEGQTNQRIEKLVFKQIKRPMYPFDDIEIDEPNN